MKLLIIGGTVFLGRHVVEAAVSRGHSVTVFHRGVHGGPVDPRLEEILGDRFGDLAPLRGRAWDAVVDTCGYVPGAVHAAAEAVSETVEHYTFISSCSVYADLSIPGMDETAPVGTLTEEQLRDAETIRTGDGVSAIAYGALYGPLKAECERTAEACLPGRVLNVRAGLIVGPHDYTDRFTYWVRRVARGGEVLAPAPPEAPVQLIDARDLADWIVRMAEERRTGTFNATGPDRDLTFGEMLEACRAAGGSQVPIVWVDEEFLTRHAVQPWTELPLWAPGPGFAGLLRFDCRRAFAAGLTFRPLVETAHDTLSWAGAADEHAGPQSRPRIPGPVGLTPEREAELLRAWRFEPGARRSTVSV